MHIHVSNLSLNIIDSDLKKLFAAYGEVLSAVIMRKPNGRSKGSARVDMINASEGRQAILCLDQTVIDGQPISVSEIKYNITDYKS